MSDGANNPIRVLLADARPAVRQALRKGLTRAADLMLAGSVSTGAHALARCRDGGADVLLVDWRLPDLTGPDLLRRLTEMGSRARVIVVADAEGVSAEQAIAAGAWGALPESVGLHELVRAIRSVAAGQIWTSRAVLTRLVRARLMPVRRNGRVRQNGLTDREAEVMRLVAAGHCNADIAETLFVEVSTVRTHLARAYRKLGAHGRSAAVRAAQVAGLLDSSLRPMEFARLDAVAQAGSDGPPLRPVPR